MASEKTLSSTPSLQEHRSAAPAATLLMSPPLEDWNNDGDFDFDNETEAITTHDAHRSLPPLLDTNASQPCPSQLLVKNRDVGEDACWNGEEDMDEDQVETIKFSSVAGSALAELAKLSSAAKLRKMEDALSASRDEHGANLIGTVTRLIPSSTPLGSKFVSRVDEEGGGDWDEDLEIPDVFPTRSLRRPASFASDLETGTPSLGSTSESTSQGARSESQGLTDVEGDLSGQAGPSTPSKGGFSSSSTYSNTSSLVSPPRPFHHPPVSIASSSFDHADDWQGDNDDADFDLEPGIRRLSLSPAVVANPSTGASMRKQPLQRTKWDSGDEAARVIASQQQPLMSSSPSASREGTDADESATDDEENLDGLEFPDELFGKKEDISGTYTKKVAPSNALKLEALLNARRGVGFTQSQKPALSSDISDRNITDGLVITDDMDLSPSRLKAKNLRDNLRQQTRKKQSLVLTSATTSSLTTIRAMSRDVNRSTPPRAPSSYSHGQDSNFGSVSRPFKKREEGASYSSPIGHSYSPAVETWAQSSAMAANDTKGGSVSGREFPKLRGARPSTPSARPLVPWRAPSRADSIDSLSIRAPARPTTPSSFQQESVGVRPRMSAPLTSTKRYTMPTNASRARQSMTGSASTDSIVGLSTQQSTSAKLMRYPKSQRIYGDGRELDAFDDLPVTSLDRSFEKKDGTSNTLTIEKLSLQSSTPFQVARSGNVQEVDHASTSSTLSRSSRRRRNARKKQKQPFLIRNLASASMGPRVVGDMRWNPVRQRWEGNEREMKDFNDALHSSVRPALITQLSPLSASSLMQGTRTHSMWSGRPDPQIPLHQVMPEERPQSKIISQGTTSDGQSPGGVRIVGDMVFDPIQLRWAHKSGVEEPDPFEEEEESDEERNTEEGEDVHRTARYTSMTSLKDFGLDEHAERGPLTQENSSVWARRSRSSESLERFTPQGSSVEASASSSRLGAPAQMNFVTSAQQNAKSSRWHNLTEQTYRDVQRALAASAQGQKRGKTIPPSDLPDDLKACGISEQLWKESIAAEERHRIEMSGFLPPPHPSTVVPASASASLSGLNGPARAHRDRKASGRAAGPAKPSASGSARRHDDAMYLLQRMARQAGRSS